MEKGKEKKKLTKHVKWWHWAIALTIGLFFVHKSCLVDEPSLTYPVWHCVVGQDSDKLRAESCEKEESNDATENRAIEVTTGQPLSNLSSDLSSHPGASAPVQNNSQPVGKYRNDCWYCQMYAVIIDFANEIANPLMAVFTILTVYYAYRAWEAYREELQVAKDASDIQLRPYLAFDDAHARWGSQRIFPNKMALQVFVRVKNIGNSAALDISQIRYSYVGGAIIVDPDDTLTNIPFTVELSDAKIFEVDGAALKALSPGDNFCFHAHFPVSPNSELPEQLPHDWVVTYAAIGKFTYRDGIFNITRRCDIQVVCGDNTSLELPSGIGIFDTKGQTDGQITES